MERELGLVPDLHELVDCIADEAVLSPEHIAVLLNRSKETIRRWCREGRLPAYSWGGKYVIFGGDFKNFMLHSRVRPKSVRDVL